MAVLYGASRRLQRLTHRAPVHTMPVGQRPNRQPLNPMIAADRRELLHLLTSPSKTFTFVITDPGHPDRDQRLEEPNQAVTTATACRQMGPNQAGRGVRQICR